MHQHGSSNQPQSNRQQTRLSLPIKLLLYASIGIIVYFLITEHRAHLAGLLPYSWLFIFVLIHLFMHVFMHEGHGGHGGGNGGNSQPLAKDPQSDSINQSTPRRSSHEGHE